MKQIIHEFQGYQMRSHSETRWANMMDALRISWVYEPGLVKTRHGMYLPDFYLPHAGIYLEVKGPRPTAIEIEKARDLKDATGAYVVFAYGDMFVEGYQSVKGGFFLIPNEYGCAEYSTYEFADPILKVLGDDYWKRYIRAGIKHPHPACSMIGDILRDYLVSLMDRSAREQQMALVHNELNDRKGSQHGQITPTEYAIRYFFNRQALRAAA